MNGIVKAANVMVAAIVLGALLTSFGCKKAAAPEGSANSPAPEPSAAAAPSQKPADVVDVTQAQKAFESAPASSRVALDEAIASMRGRDYASALETFQKLAVAPALKPEQKRAAADVAAQLQSLVNAGGRR